MQLFKKITLSLFITLSLLFTNCEKTQIVSSTIGFESDVIRINASESVEGQIDFSVSPSAPANSVIEVDIDGRNVDDILDFDSPMQNGNLIIDVPEGRSLVSVGFTVNTNRQILDSVSFELSIISLGPGLVTNPLEGRFLRMDVIKQEDRGLELPYLEDFSECAAGIFPPESWQQRVVQQNEEESAEWRCAGNGVVANAFVPESNDQNNSEVWLVSPTFSLPASENNELSFDLDRRFETSDQNLVPFDVLISTDYSPEGSFEEASWNRFESGFNAIQNNDPDIDNIENSGLLSLSDFSGSELTIAFVYRAGAPGGFDATILRIGNFSIE